MPGAPAGSGGRSLGRSALLIGLAAIAALATYRFLPYPDQACRGLALLVFVAVLWLTEAVHVTVTALLVPVATLLLRIEGWSTPTAFASFADPIIFLFLGGFALATALSVQGLDRKLAFGLLALARGRLWMVAILMFLTTAGLSMWMNNTATTAMMLPLALGVLASREARSDRGTFVFMLLGIAYAANIGGMGTLIGSAPNGIAARAIGMDFMGWLRIGLPLVAALLPIMFIVLWVLFRPRLTERVELPPEPFAWNLPRLLTLAVFGMTVLGWIQGDRVGAWLGVGNPDTVVAMVAVLLIAALGLAPWAEVARRTDWSVLLLFGGGLTLSHVLRTSGASAVLGDVVSGVLSSASPLTLVMGVAVFIIFLTEFTSNTASAALLVPIFVAISERLGLPPQQLVMVIGLGASCAFMLPVATPPNAIVFGSGHVAQREMVRAGIVLNVIGAAVVGLWCAYAMR